GIRELAAFLPAAAALRATKDPVSAGLPLRFALLPFPEDGAEKRLILAGNPVQTAPADLILREIADGLRSAGFSGAGGRAQTGRSGSGAAGAADLRSSLLRTRRGGGVSVTTEAEPLTRKAGTEAAERDRRSSTA